MSEVAPAGGGPNRLFIVIALGLVGLLIIGIVVFLAFMLVIQPMLSAARPSATPPRAVTITFATTPTRAALVVFTPTAPPTDTPAPTLVIQPAGGGTPVVGNALTPTSSISGTVTPGTGTPGAGLPKTGVGEDLLVLAGGIVLVFVIIAARRARSTIAA